MAQSKAAEKAEKATAAKKAAAMPFDPASVPVMPYVMKSFNVGRHRHYMSFASLDGVAAAAVAIGQADAARHAKAGHKIAYVGCDLCIVTTDIVFVEKIAAKQFNAFELPNALAKVQAFYRENVGKPLSVDPVQFENRGGSPYGLYDACEEERDFVKVDAAMAKEYAAILKCNAAAAKSPNEVLSLYFEGGSGRTTEEAIVRFAVAAHEHDKLAVAAHAEAIRYSNVWKAKHGLEKVDHSDPRYRAFTAMPWHEYLSHRDFAKDARALLKRATESYSQSIYGIPF